MCSNIISKRFTFGQQLGDDRWNLNNIHYVRLPDHIELNRAIVFGKQDRKERLARLRTGLNQASRKLMKRMRPCNIRVAKLAVDLKPSIATSPTSSIECKYSFGVIKIESNALCLTTM